MTAALFVYSSCLLIRAFLSTLSSRQHNRRLWSGKLGRDFRFYVSNAHHLISIWRHAKGHPFDAADRIVKEFIKLGFCFYVAERVATVRAKVNHVASTWQYC